MRWISFLALLLLAGVPASARDDAVDQYVSAEVARQRVPGLAIAITRHGHLVRAEGYGLANLEHHVPVHPDTLFKTGAVGMQFTAVAVMLLAEDGKIALDRSVRTYLPGAPKSWQPITIRNLLNHTSGLPATPNGEFRTDYTDDQLLAIIYKQDLNFPAGTRWRFSYTDYIVLGFLVRKVSGEYYADLLARRVFAPLNMRTARPIDELAVVPNRAAGYELHDGEWRNAPWVSATANSTADGSLYLSALDYAAWGTGLADHAILKPDSWAEIGRPARLASGRTYPYGFGWFLGEAGGADAWWHSGTWQGFQTFIVRYLADEMTVAVVINGDSGDPGKIARHVAAMLNPALSPTPGAPIEDRDQAVTNRVKQVLQSIADGRSDYGHFAYFSRADFSEMMDEYRATLQALGARREVTLFGRERVGDDEVYRYRARYDRGLVDVAAGFTPAGKIAQLTLAPVEDWNDPILK